MKKIFYLLLLSFCIYACSSDNEEKETILDISVTELLFSAEENSKTVEIISNSIWKISNIPDWITIDKNDSENNAIITLKVKENPKEEERSTTLKITAKEKEKTIKVKQLAKSVALALSKTEVIIEAEPTENQTFDIISNEDWTISDIPEWCTLDKEKGNGNQTITIISEKNYLDTKRDAKIKITAGSKSESIIISQEALNIQLSFSNADLTNWYFEASMNFYEEASSQSITIRSNTKWFIQSDADWCNPDTKEGMDNSILTISALKNENNKDRKTEIYIIAGSKSIKLFIQQGAAIPEENSPYEITLKDNGPRIGDTFLKKQIEYVDPGNAGENITWNFSNVKVYSDQFKVSYTAPHIEDGYYWVGRERFKVSETPSNSLLEYYENDITIYFYQLKDNFLQSIGHENSTNLLHYNPRMILGLFPMKYNDYYKQNYNAKGLYSGTVEIQNEGYTETKADGYGTIILPDGTYKNALRVKWKQTISTPNISPEEKEKDLREYTVYKWYVKGYRYPVFETHRLIFPYNNLELSAFAFYFPPKDHTYLQQDMKTKLVTRKHLNNNTVKKTNRLESVFPILQTKRK